MRLCAYCKRERYQHQLVQNNHIFRISFLITIYNFTRRRYYACWRAIIIDVAKRARAAESPCSRRERGEQGQGTFWVPVGGLTRNLAQSYEHHRTLFYSVHIILQVHGGWNRGWESGAHWMSAIWWSHDSRPCMVLFSRSYLDRSLSWSL